MTFTPACTTVDPAPRTGRHRRTPVLLLACGLAAAACLTGCAAGPGQQHRTVSYGVNGPVRTLVVHGGTGDIHVTGGAAAVHVTETQGYRGSAPHATHTVSGATLTLGYTCHDCSVGYDVRVPSGVAVDLVTDTGDVRLGGLAAAVTVSTDTGHVTATGLTGGRVRFSADTGDVDAAFGRAPATLQAASGTGDVRLTLPSGTAYEVQARSVTGSVSVGVRRDTSAAHRVTARADTGDVTIRTA